MAVSVLINGVDRSNFVAPVTATAAAQLGFSRSVGARGTATFTLLVKNGTYEPVIGQSVVFMDGTRRAFTGSLNDFKKTRLGNAGGFMYDCACVSLEQRLDKRLISAEFFQMTPGAVVAQILSNYVPDENIAVGQIDTSIGPTVSSLYSRTRASDIFDQMATLANATWFCDDAAGLFFFVSRTTFNAPWTFTEAESLRGKDDLAIIERNRTDFRNRQSIRFAFSALPPELEVIQGDGVATLFRVLHNISTVVKLFLTTSVQASVAGTFTGLPNPGDTISITDGTVTTTYTWRSGLPNNLAIREVLIGATAAECASNFIAAVNNSGSPGFNYSWPTPSNAFCIAASSGGGGITLSARDPGTNGNSITVAASCAHFSWGAGTLSGGSDGTTTEQTIGVAGVDTADYAFLPGGKSFFGPAIAVGTALLIQYYPLDGDVVTVEDSASVSARAAVEGESGIYENLVDDSQNGDWNSAFQEAVGYQAAYDALLEQLTLQTDRDGIIPGQYLMVNLPSLGIASVRYFVQQVDGVYMGGASGIGMTHFRYTITAISSARIGTWLQFWANLAKSGSGGNSGSASPVTLIGSGGSGSGSVPGFFVLTIVSNHVAIEISNGRNQKLILNQATQVTIDNPTSSGSTPTAGDWLTLYILQDATGGRPTPAWGSAFGSDVTGQVIDPTPSTRSAYLMKYHDDGKWHLDSFRTGQLLT